MVVVNFILQKRLPFLYGFFHLHKIFYTLYIQFKKIKLQKYLVLVVYFSGVLGIFSGIALLSLITDRPLHNFVVGMIVIFIGWILELLVHALLVWWSLKRNNLKLRDTATNYFSNVIGILGISLAIISYVTEKENLFFLAACLIVIVVLFFVTFDFQRVYEYWKTKKMKMFLHMAIQLK